MIQNNIFQCNISKTLYCAPSSVNHIALCVASIVTSLAVSLAPDSHENPPGLY